MKEEINSLTEENLVIGKQIETIKNQKDQVSCFISSNSWKYYYLYILITN
jgi:hypothetical protein